MFRISKLPDEEKLSKSEIWEIGDRHISKPDRPVKARADLLASSVYKINLKVIPSESPHRHANIRPLPLTDKKARRVLATKLANASKLVLPPEDT